MKIDLDQILSLVNGPYAQETTGVIPSFTDGGGAETSELPAQKLSPDTRMTNLEVQVETLYKGLHRLADEIRITRDSLNDMSVRINNGNRGVRM
jgi:hypothetical protein